MPRGNSEFDDFQFDEAELRDPALSALLSQLGGSADTAANPPTTSAAITTFATGLAPQQHAVTGWFMHLKELGAVSTILPVVQDPPRHATRVPAAP